MATRKKVKDDEGHEYEIEIDDEEDDSDEDEDDENIYLTEADLRWLKAQRKAVESESQSKNGTTTQRKSQNGIAVRKRSEKDQRDTTSNKKTRVRRLTLSP